MRRKLFFYALFLTFSVGMFLSISYSNDTFSLDSRRSTYEGKVVSVEKGESNRQFVVDTADKRKILLSYYGKDDLGQDLLGTVIEFETTLSIPKGKTNPRCFDYRLYLKSMGIDYVGTTAKIVKIKDADNQYDKICRFFMVKKENFLNSINDVETRNFVEGILFGNTDRLDEDVYDQFKINGTAHILAVSGLHIGIMYELIQRLLGKKQSLLKATITVSIMISLGIVMEWTPSVSRAIGMILIKMYAQYFDKRYDSLTAISLIAIIMIAINPYVVFNTSFQMSFIAIMSIIFINPCIPRIFPDFLAVIISVNAGLIVYQAYQFNSLSITSLFANIPVVYLAGILLPITFFQFALFIITGLNIEVIEYAVQALTTFLIRINSICTFGMDGIDVVSPKFITIILIYVLGGFLLSETFYILRKRKKIKNIIIFTTIILFISVIFSSILSSNFDEAQVVFVDVGQGACVHIKDGKSNILIDGGGKADYEVGRKTLKPYLLKNGASHIDLAIATHKHTDHYKGLEELAADEFASDIKVGLAANNDFRVSKDVYIDTLWPLTEKEAKNQEENKNCSVFMLHYNDKKVLITGDLDAEGEEGLLKAYGKTGKLKADIMQIGHHGSQYSTSDDFLDAVNPKYCIIQVGKNNYGHPHTKIIEKLKQRCIMILRNDIHGAVGFSFEHEKIKYFTMCKIDRNNNGL